MNNLYKEETSPSSQNDVLANKIAILYSDVKRDYFPTEAQYIAEKDAYTDASLIANYIEKITNKILLLPGDENLTQELKKYKPDIAFNLIYSIRGDEVLPSAIPGILEILDIPYTGAGLLGYALNCNKYLTKELLQQSGIPVPVFQLFNSHTDFLNPALRFPLISKLNEIHGGVEITQDAISKDEKHLRDRAKYLIETYKQPVLVEEFIVGREITTILLEGLNKKVYLAEKKFLDDNEYHFATFEDQWLTSEYEAFTYEKIEDEQLKELTKRAFQVLKMDDYAKFDVRIDDSGRYYFIDPNCNPAFGPKESATALSVILDLHGISFMDILRRLIANTLSNNKVNF